MSNDAFAAFVEEQRWLAPVEQPVQRAVRAAFDAGGKGLRNALHGTWLHEPLHAVLTDVPIGAWTATVALDTAAALGGNRSLDRAADAALWVGLGGAVLSAVTGLNDWADLKGAPRRIGLAHALLNSTALGLFVASAMARRNRSRATGRTYAAVAYLIASAAAHLGGNLVYEHGVGMEQGAQATARSGKRGEEAAGPSRPAPEPPSAFTGEANDYRGFAEERIRNHEMMDVNPEDARFTP